MAPRKEKEGEKGQRQNTKETPSTKIPKNRDTAKNKLRHQNFKTIRIFNQFWGI